MCPVLTRLLDKVINRRTSMVFPPFERYLHLQH